MSVVNKFRSVMNDSHARHNMYCYISSSVKEYVTIAVLTSIQFKITEQVKYNVFNRIVDVLDEELRDKQ